jgi:ABC-type sulfate transport system substrate-binding protein
MPPAAGGKCTPASSPILMLAPYSIVYDVYGKLISNFEADWKDKHDSQSLQFLTSFAGSTTQAQNIVNGLQADVYASSLDPDVKLVQDTGLITHDW